MQILSTLSFPKYFTTHILRRKRNLNIVTLEAALVSKQLCP